MSASVKWKPRDCAGGWDKKAVWPVISEAYGTTFAPCVLKENGLYKMWFSWLETNLIAYSESKDGLHWGLAQVALTSKIDSKWGRNRVCCPSALRKDGKYLMWYAGQLKSMEQQQARSSIGFAVSTDGVHWQAQDEAVLEPTLPWEHYCVTQPCVRWDEERQCFRMWYAAGRLHQADAIGYAESKDGLHWEKHSQPVLLPVRAHYWEMTKVNSPQMIVGEDGMYYLFYSGVDGDGYSSIGVARSKDGISGWERYEENPVIAGTDGSWDYHSEVECSLLKEENGYRMWYAGRMRDMGMIGFAQHKGYDLFPPVDKPELQAEMRNYQGEWNYYSTRPHLSCLDVKEE